MMKFYISALIFFSLISNLSKAQLITRRSCGTVSNTERLLANDPAMAVRMSSIESHTTHFLETHRPGETGAAIVTIPVVFHVLYNNAAQNISEARILAQINQLNLDFAKLNSDINTVPAAFSSLAADSKIQFCLAQRDPSGNASTGIIRKSTAVTSFTQNDDIKFNSTGGDNAWDRNRYLNIWVGNLGNQLLGYAQTPGGPANSDGVVLLYSSVGSMTTPGLGAPYNLGRTATHEVGHWLNLRHIWGDDNGACSGSDLVTDTPNQGDANYSCPTFPLVDACITTSPGVMFMNYMDYVDDNCMKMFTNGQALRMQALFSTGGARASLMTSNGCQAVSGTFGFNTVAPVSITCGNSTAVASLVTTSTSGFSNPITLTATGNPSGTTVSFSVNPVTPGNTTTVSLNNTSALQAGTYNITVTGTSGTATQTANISFAVVAGTPPNITTQPSSVAVCNGAVATFSSATSTSGATIQWQQSTDGGTNWTDISGATNASYATPVTTSSMNNNKFRVVMKSQCAVTTSTVATLTVNPLISVTSQPVDVTTGTGTNINFSITATGASVTYQWQDSSSSNNWQNIAGATGSSYTVSNTTLGMSGTKYRVILNSTCGNSTSNVALLTVVPGSFSLSNGNSVSVPCGTDLATVTLNSSVTGTFTTPINLTALNLPTGTTANIATNPLTPGNSTTVSLNNSDSLTPGSYVYTVTGTANALVQSTTINVSITPAAPSPIQPNEEPDDVSAGISDNVNFATTYNTNVSSFQWQDSSSARPNWTDIVGATNSSYIKSVIRLEDNNTYYRVRIVTNCGVLYSKAALLSIPLTIHPNPTYNGNLSITTNFPDQNKVMRKVSAVVIYNNSGAKVFEKKVTGSTTQKIDCNVSTLSTGIYQVIILDDAGSVIQKAPVLINNLK